MVVMPSERLVTIRIDVRRPADRELVLRCGRRGDPGGRPTRVAVLFNRRRVGVLGIGAGLADHRLRLPAQVQQAGENQLAISSPVRRRAPASEIVCQSLRFEGPRDDMRPRVDGDTIVFVEVKTLRTADDTFRPEDHVNQAKQRHLITAARRYMAQHPDPQAYYRFDVVSIVWPENGTPQITLYRDAFHP